MAYNPNIDYAAEIEKEFQKDKPSWSKIATLAQARNKKIEGEGIQTKSTEDYINELMSKYGYADPMSGSPKKNSTQGTSYTPPNILNNSPINNPSNNPIENQQ